VSRSTYFIELISPILHHSTTEFPTVYIYRYSCIFRHLFTTNKCVSYSDLLCNGLHYFWVRTGNSSSYL